jgi:hypothetical protein
MSLRSLPTRLSSPRSVAVLLVVFLLTAGGDVAQGVAATRAVIGSPNTRGPVKLFAASSIWNQPLAPAAPVDPTSVARMSAFGELISTEEQTGLDPYVNTTAYSTTLYVVGPDQLRVPVHLSVGPWGAPLQTALDEGVPIPEGAEPAAGTDGEMTIYQPSSDTLWEFWRAVKGKSEWRASWGGAMEHVSASPGYYSDTSWRGLAPSEGWNWGATATSLPAIAGMITIAELRAGRIEHALALAIPNACSASFSYPAQRSDGSEESADCIPEGAHMRLSASLNLASLHLPHITQMLAEAAQRYGVIVRDITHEGPVFYAEDPVPTGSNPYLGPMGLFGGLAPWQVARAFPWNKLQLLKLHICTAAPCRA